MTTTDTESSLYDLIRTKRDTRAYTATPISADALHRILQAGRMAGTAKGGQWCRFIVLQDEERRRAVAECGQFTAALLAAPLVIVIATYPYEGDWDAERATAFDAGRAAQNMMLAAWADGIASCPVTLHRETDAARVLGLPADLRVQISLAFGQPDPAGTGRPPRPRLPLEEFVRYEHWDSGAPAH